MGKVGGNSQTPIGPATAIPIRPTPPVAPPQPPAPVSPTASGLEWMDWMRARIGEPEMTGAPATAFDIEVFDHTSYGSLNGIMKAGCAATACAALEEKGYASPHNAAAISFATYGDPCDLKPGCLVVFRWPSGDHHVTFCDHLISSSLVACLGGNQNHQVKVSAYEIQYIVATRWPVRKSA